MAIVRWQPRTSVANSNLHEIDRLMDSDMSRLVDWAFGGGDRWSRPMVPALDVCQEENRYVVRADLPGMRQEDIEITYQDGILTLKGEKRSESEKKEGNRYYVRERFDGKFGRNLQLP